MSKLEPTDFEGLRNLYSTHADDGGQDGRVEFEKDIALINTCFGGLNARRRFNELNGGTDDVDKKMTNAAKVNLQTEITKQITDVYDERMRLARTNKDEFGIETAFEEAMKEIGNFVQRAITHYAYNRPLTFIFIEGQNVDKDSNINFWRNVILEALPQFLVNTLTDASALEKAMVKAYLVQTEDANFSQLPWYSRLSGNIQRLFTTSGTDLLRAQKTTLRLIDDISDNDFCGIEDDNCMEVETFKKVLLKSMDVKDVDLVFDTFKNKRVFRLLGDFKREISLNAPSDAIKSLIAVILIQMTVGRMKTMMIVAPEDGTSVSDLEKDESKPADRNGIEGKDPDDVPEDAGSESDDDSSGPPKSAEPAAPESGGKTPKHLIMPFDVFETILKRLTTLVSEYTGKKESEVETAILNSAFVKKDNGEGRFWGKASYKTWYDVWFKKLEAEFKAEKRGAHKNNRLFLLYLKINGNSRDKSADVEAASNFVYIGNESHDTLVTFGEHLATHLVDFNKAQRVAAKQLIYDVTNSTKSIQNRLETERDVRELEYAVSSVRETNQTATQQAEQSAKRLVKLEAELQARKAAAASLAPSGLGGGFALEALVNREIAAL
jgi:hypothetical protein